MVLTSFEQIVEAVKANPVKRKLLAVAANDEHCIDAVLEAANEGLIEPVLIGDAEIINKLLAERGATVDKIYDYPDVEEAAAFAVELVKKGEGDILFKGKLESKQILKPVVNKETGIGLGGTLSFVSAHAVPWYHKMIFDTDGGVVPYPDLDMKKDEINNAVYFLKKLGYENPKVAAICAVEKVNPKMPETQEARALQEMNERGEIKDCIVEGPLSFDIAIRKEAAIAKGFESQVSGDVDLLVVPNIHVGNIMGKCMTESGGQMAGIVVGAQVPVLMTSRAASTQEKFNNIAMAAYAADR